MNKKLLGIIIFSLLWCNVVASKEDIIFFKCEIVKDRIDHSKLTKIEKHPFKKGYKFDLKIDMDRQIFFIDEYLFYMWMIYPDRITGYQENYPNKLFIELDRYGGNIKITDVEAKPKKTIANFQMECGQKSKIF
jgi:hypothetical protein